MTNLLCALCLIPLMEHGHYVRIIETMRRSEFSAQDIVAFICNAPRGNE